MRKALRILFWTFVIIALMGASFVGGVLFVRFGPSRSFGLAPMEVPAHPIPPTLPAVPVPPRSGGPVFVGSDEVLRVWGESAAIDAPDRSAQIDGRVLGPVTARSVWVKEHAAVFGKVRAIDSVVLEGEVAGDVEGATVILRPSAQVAGSVRATSHLAVESGATVTGSLTPPEGQSVRIVSPSGGPGPFRARPYGPGSGPPQPPQVVVRTTTGGWPWLAGFFGFIALGTMAFAFFSADAAHVAETALQRPARYLTRGLLALLIAPPLAGLLALTVIGIPLAVAVAAVLTAALSVGIAAAGLAVGKRVGQHLPQEWGITPLMQVVLGTLLLVVTVAIPVAGALLVGLTLLVGFGGVADLWYPRLREAWRRWRQRPRET